MRFDIIKRSYLWVTAWLAMIPIAIYLFLSNVILSIQFTWWMEIKVNWKIDQVRLKDEMWKWLTAQWYKDFEISVWQQDWYDDILLKIAVDSDEQVNKLSEYIQWFLIENKFLESKDQILETSGIGPSVGDYMKQTALKATLLWILFMGIYILVAFSWLKKFISPWLLAFITIITMIFDIALPAGAYGILMKINPAVQVDSVFIIAILTIMGYSINDTIIIFDRIRENFKINEWKLLKWKITYREVFEESLWQTMRRSFWTLFTTFLAVVAMYTFWTWMMKLFAFTFGLWVVFGSYSSIFISAPLAYILTWKFKEEFKK